MSSSTAELDQKLDVKLYQKRLRDDVKSLVENLEQALRLMKVEPGSGSECSQARLQEAVLQMRVRAANMTRAGESLMRLIWDMKEFVVTNDFPLINERITKETQSALDKEQALDAKLLALRDDISAELHELEHEYYHSLVK